MQLGYTYNSNPYAKIVNGKDECTEKKPIVTTMKTSYLWLN